MDPSAEHRHHVLGADPCRPQPAEPFVRRRHDKRPYDVAAVSGQLMELKLLGS